MIKNLKNIEILTILIYITLISCRDDQFAEFKSRIVSVSKGWAGNSINTVIFRRNSVTSYNNHQYAAFYDDSANVILAKRHLDSSKWKIHHTRYTGNIKDAHNSISIMIDGDGYLHMAWDHHGNSLNYCKSKFPEGLELGSKISMTGQKEQNLTYPEFYKLPDGNLIFVYRDGSSGMGNLIMNFYERKTQKWSQLHNNLIDGEGKRNAYWQMTIGPSGMLHISWVWRESWDVATNHDICYAKSNDYGKTWIKSSGEKYKLPITIKNAEIAAKIPQNSELINQTSMVANSGDYPYIASYWTPDNSNIPQYHLIYNDGEKWQTKQITDRKTSFSLSGGGTKKIPISRPQILVDKDNMKFLVYRDRERDNRVSLASCDDLEKNSWTTTDLTSFSVGQWEPTYDTELWKSENKLHLFIQNVGQGDAEQVENIPAQPISILEWIDKK